MVTLPSAPAAFADDGTLRNDTAMQQIETVVGQLLERIAAGNGAGPG